jgi:SPP1 gp7 family putative phage head morphogenesis protein
VAPEAAAKLEQRITRAVASGERHEAIAGELQTILSSSGKRARMIARDQVGKLYGQINSARQQSLGITHFTWRTANDRRVRAEHRALNGKVFRFDDPPAEGLPGQPVLCRCYAEPVFDALLGEQ